MFHKFQVSHVTHQYFFLERTWLVYIQDGYGHIIKNEKFFYEMLFWTFMFVYEKVY
jgi:hypothetical protein